MIVTGTQIFEHEHIIITMFDGGVATDQRRRLEERCKAAIKLSLAADSFASTSGRQRCFDDEA